MKTVYKDWTIESKYVGNKNWSCNSMHNNYNNHRIVVTNNKTKKWTAFEFWESITEKEIKTEDQLMFAFYCFLMDAFAGYNNDYIGFCNEFGYDSYDNQSKKIYKACQNSAEKVKRVLPGILEDGAKYSEIMDDLTEKYGC